MSRQPVSTRIVQPEYSTATAPERAIASRFAFSEAGHSVTSRSVRPDPTRHRAEAPGSSTSDRCESDEAAQPLVATAARRARSD